MMKQQDPDLVVIGSGPGGYRAAVLGALRGLHVAVVEKGVWGGCCLNRGCVPKKDWHHTAKLLQAGAGFARRGIAGTLAPDFEGAWQHQRRTVLTVRDSYLDYLDRLGVRRIEGEARFVSAQEIAIRGGGNEVRLRARHFIVATGSGPWFPPALPPTPGRILSSDDLFEQPPPPGRRVAVVGSGVIGSEFAFILHMLGLDVHWLTLHAPLSASRFSPAAIRTLGAALDAAGVAPRTGARVAASEIGADHVRLALEDGHELEVDWVLVAGGRRPHTAGLGLDAAGVACDEHGFIAVDAQQRSSVPHIFAIGDVVNREMTANHALADATVAMSNILTPGSARRDKLAVPTLVHSAVEMALLGMNEEEAEDAGLDPATGFAAFSVNPRALGQDATAGFVRLVADLDGGRLLGAEIVGEEAGELINQIEPLIGRDDALARIAATRFNHPARAEEILNAAETLAVKWGLTDRVFAAKD